MIQIPNKKNKVKKMGRPEKKIYSQSEMIKILESYLNEETREISWIDEDEFSKAKFQFTSSLDAAAEENGLKMYGLKASWEEVLEIAWKLAEDLSLRVRGIDQPISLEIIKQNRKFIIINKEEMENEIGVIQKTKESIGINCPDCLTENRTVLLIFQEGCFHCPTCGYSRC